MLTVQTPLDGRNLRPSNLIDIAHHRLDLDAGLEVGQLIVGHFLDDAAWVLSVEDIEFQLNETRYLLAVLTRAARSASRPRRGAPLTTRQTEYLLRILGSRINEVEPATQKEFSV